ncbi:hypothetical protein T439DRAFT_357730 [Meredithblackwellia eburnea MCA 4105]
MDQENYSQEEQAHFIQVGLDQPTPRFSTPTRRHPRSFCRVLLGTLAFIFFLIVFLKKSPSSNHLTQHLSNYFPPTSAQAVNLARPQFHSTGCSDPFLEPGYFVRNLTVPEENRWVPFDSSCSAPRLLSRVKAGYEDFPWLQGRTIALFGDSVEKRATQYICAYLGGEFDIIDPEHPLHPPRPVNASNGWDYRFPNEIFKADMLGVRGSPVRCYVASLDLLILLTFHTGLDNTGFWSRMPEQWYHPWLANERVTQVLAPLLSILNRPTVDLISASSHEWDAKRFYLKTINKGETPTDINAQYSEWPEMHQDSSPRLHELVKTLLESFPHRTGGYPILWRIGHEIISFRHYQLVGKLWARATEQVVRMPEFAGQIIETRIGRGLEGMGIEGDWMLDTVHPHDYPFNQVYGDQLLFHLRRAVTGGDE